MTNPFATPEMALGYARSRPPVHAEVLALARPHLGAYYSRFANPADTGPGAAPRPTVAVDVGCGAGLSTRALLPFADCVIGFDPAPAMAVLGPVVSPGAHFLVAAAEVLPFASASVDLLAAAGSLNYVRLPQFFAEARRVLAPAGQLLVYDYSHGRHFAESSELDLWFQQFLSTYPPVPGQATPLDPARLAVLDSGFSLIAHSTFRVGLPLTLPAYLDYLLTSTNVAAALAAGHRQAEIRQWCLNGLSTFWGSAARIVHFPGYFALLQPTPSAPLR